MRALEDQSGVVRLCDGGGFFLRLCAPKDEGHRLRELRHRCHHIIGKSLPTKVLVTVGLAFFYCENGVQEQNALFGPSR